MSMLDKIAPRYTTTVSRIGAVFVALSIVVLSSVGVVKAVDQPKMGLAISPPTFELAANAGDVLKNSLRVDNLVDIPLEVSVDARNFTALGEEGGIDLTPAGEDNFSLASWISVSPKKVTIPPHESKTFDYTIDIPINASPGGRFGSIIFQTAPSTELSGQSGVAISQEVGTLIFVKIAGAVTEKASVAGFTTINNIHNKGPVDFDIRIKNDGNVHFKPKGTITISNFFGKQIATIPINEQNVLPGATRKMDASWGSGMFFGRYNATLSLVYGKDGQVITASTAFWGFPYKLMGLILLVLVLVGAALYPLRHRIWRAFKILFGKE